MAYTEESFDSRLHLTTQVAQVAVSRGLIVLTCSIKAL